MGHGYGVARNNFQKRLVGGRVFVLGVSPEEKSVEKGCRKDNF